VDFSITQAIAGAGPLIGEGLVPKTAQTFRGDHVEYLLRIQGEQLRARIYQPLGAVGERIYVQFPPEHIFPVIDDLPYHD
jgi:hypothetical protein